MSALHRAIATYNERITSLSARITGIQGSRQVHRDHARAIVAGTDLPYDELMDESWVIAALALEEALRAGVPAQQIVAGVWRAGVIVGALFETEDSP